MPPFLPKRASGITLPSRLATLGNQNYSAFSAVTAMDVGNAVVGFESRFWDWLAGYINDVPFLVIFQILMSRDAVVGLQQYKEIHGSTDRHRHEHVLIPRATHSVDNVFTPQRPRRTTGSEINVHCAAPLLLSHGANAVVHSIECLMIVALMIVSATHIATINVGQAWAVGTAMCFYAMYQLSQLRMRADGVMGFCRSMGVPETEEMMFSYSWKVEEENVRTLGKAVWNAGVGVWVDVIKLTPGDEIRPVVRTMMRCVYRMVVFMSPDYAASPNCCVEWCACVWLRCMFASRPAS
jgi:hypothetical protein